MPTSLRTQGVRFNNGQEQERASVKPQWASLTTLSSVINTYRNFPNGTKVAFWERRYQNTGFTGNGSRTLEDWYRRVYRKDGNNSWTEVGG